jgi:hypothetical protein
MRVWLSRPACGGELAMPYACWWSVARSFRRVIAMFGENDSRGVAEGQRRQESARPRLPTYACQKETTRRYFTTVVSQEAERPL